MAQRDGVLAVFRILPVSLLLIGLLSSPVQAIQVELADGEVSGSFDTTVTLGSSFRVGDRNPDLVGVPNGGRANSVNTDNGNLNYGQGDPVSAAGKVSHELLLEWRNFSMFARAFYFYDVAVRNVATDRTDLGDTAIRKAGRRIQPLDAYGTADFDLAGQPFSIRVGNQVMNWGESTFVQNGINVINPVDVTQLRVAGSRLQDALRPVPAVNVRVGLGERFSLEGFYQFLWAPTELEPEGTFFSTTDIASPGGRFAMLGFGQIGDDPVPPPGANPPVGTAIPNGGDRDAGDGGEFGFALRWFEPLLYDSELGFYYIRYHSRLPLLSARTGTIQGALAGDYARSGKYLRVFPEDIDLFGFSFNTEIPRTGVALQGEVSYKKDQPLQLDDVELLFAGLTPLDPLVFGQNQIGVFGFDERVQGYRRKDTIQPQITLTSLLGPTLGADEVVLLGEVAGTWIFDLEDKDELRYEAPGTHTSGNPFYTMVGIQPETTPNGQFADDFSWGYRLLVQPTFNDAIASVNLSPRVAFSHDVDGTTPSPIANFVDGRKTVTAALAGVYLQTISFDLSYTNFFDGGSFNNLLNDRDFVSLTMSYSF